MLNDYKLVAEFEDGYHRSVRVVRKEPGNRFAVPYLVFQRKDFDILGDPVWYTVKELQYDDPITSYISVLINDSKDA